MDGWLSSKCLSGVSQHFVNPELWALCAGFTEEFWALLIWSVKVLKIPSIPYFKDQKTQLEKSYCGSHATERLFSVIVLKLTICFGEVGARQIIRFYSFWCLERF